MLTKNLVDLIIRKENVSKSQVLNILFCRKGNWDVKGRDFRGKEKIKT